MCKHMDSSEPVKRTTVVNLRKEDYDVYIGRAGRGQDGYFGNPFTVSEGGREACIEKYKKYFFKRLSNDPEFKERVLKLRGKKLGCFCKPLACHGDVIAGYVDGTVCSCCSQPVHNPSWDNRRYHLCDGCINASIIGYDQPKVIGIVGSRRRDSDEDGMNMQFDPVMEDYLSFMDDHFTLEAGEGSVIIGRPSPSNPVYQDFFAWHPYTIGSVVTPRNRTYEEITPEERTARHICWMEEQDKFAVHVASMSASAGPTESDRSFRERFGLMSVRDLGKSARKEPVAIHINGEAIFIDEAMNIDTDRHSWKRADRNPCPICDGTDTAAHRRWKPVRDILDMSWPEQREFRWNDPDGYAQWVADLKEEMGEHFDESLVLPEFKFGERVQKLRELHPDDDLDGMFDYSRDEFVANVPEDAY